MDLEKMCDIPALAGDEYELHEYLAKSYTEQGLELVKDRLGSVFGECRVENSPFKVMVSSNMDESGGLIDEISQNGLLSFVPVGLYSKQDFVNQRVCVLTRNHERVYGYVVSINGKIWVDAGFHDATEVARAHVQVGDTFVLDIPARLTTQGLIAKNVANRAGLYVANQVMKQLQHQLLYTLAVGGITQSIVGQRGAITATNAVKPDVAIVIDAAYVKDYQPNTVYLRYFDKTLLPNNQLIQRLKATAEQLGYSVIGHVQQVGTDGSFIHKSLQGTPTVVVVIPLQTSQSFVQLLRLADLEPLQQTLTAFLSDLTLDVVQRMAFQAE